MTLPDFPAHPSGLAFLRSTEVRRDEIALGTESNTKETSDRAADEAERTIRAFSPDENDLTEIQSSTTPEHDCVRMISAQRKDEHSMHGPCINRLPPELLSLVFTKYQEWSGFSVILPPSHHFPWTLGQVCSHWRQVLLSTAEIWGNIEIHQNLRPSKEDIIPGLLEKVMTRAHGPVSLRVPLLRMTILRQVITPYAGRFQSLQLTLSFDSLGMFLNLPVNFTSLRSLKIDITNAYLMGPIMTHQTDALQNASHLDEFFILYPHNVVRISPSYTPSALRLPWSQLTVLKCHGAHSIADLHAVLSQCKSLTKFSVMVRRSLVGEVVNRTPQPITLPRLRTLSIKLFYDRLEWVPFLAPFILPSLEILEYKAWGGVEAFEALVARSGCHLKELKSFRKPSSPDPLDTNHLCNLLRSSPSLILLGTIPLPPVVFNLISHGELLPHITTLNCSVEIGGLDAFLDLMERYPPGHGIRTARISLHTSPHHGSNEEDHVRQRFLHASERFAVEGRDITMEICT